MNGSKNGVLDLDTAEFIAIYSMAFLWSRTQQIVKEHNTICSIRILECSLKTRPLPVSKFSLTVARPQVAKGRDGLQMWRVSENTLNKHSRTAGRA